MSDTGSWTKPRVKEISRHARKLYRHAHNPLAWMQVLRPYICPFDELIPLVPSGARILDVGCGAGLFLGLLADFKKISAGYGVDSSATAVDLARKIHGELGPGIPVHIECCDESSKWPGGRFEVVSLIDVLHHVPRSDRAAVVQAAAARILPGGILLYKDMVTRPRWRAWCNQLHDLLLARQWIHHVPAEEIDLLASQAGLDLALTGACNRLWYGHEWRIYRRSTADTALQAHG